MRIKNSKAIKVIINLLVAACAILLIALAIHMRGAEVQDQPVLFGSAFSLLPPLVAIILAVVTKEVYSSLFVGIVVGAMLYSSGNPELALNTMLFHEEGGLVAGITDSSHAGVLVIVIMLATMTTLLTRSGSAEASTPNSVTLPERVPCGVSAGLRWRSSVVLPPPEGPQSTSSSPSSTQSETSRRAGASESG